MIPRILLVRTVWHASASASARDLRSGTRPRRSPDLDDVTVVRSAVEGVRTKHFALRGEHNATLRTVCTVACTLYTQRDD